jgi:hypothetical protein
MNRLRTRVPPARELGQATTEFVVLCLALIPLFLLTPMIAKYFDIAHATQMASRYLALEAMERQDNNTPPQGEAELAGEVRRRFFSNAGAPVKTGDTAGDFAAHRNAFWVDTAGRPLIARFDRDVRISFGTGGGPTQAMAFQPGGDDLPFDRSRVRGVKNALGLQARGIYTADVDVALANLPQGIKSLAPFDRLNLRIRRRTGVVIDGWNAASDASIIGRIDSTAIFPGRALRATSPLAGASVTVFEVGQVPQPRTGELPLWQGVVPQDRRP